LSSGVSIAENPPTAFLKVAAVAGFAKQSLHHGDLARERVELDQLLAGEHLPALRRRCTLAEAGEQVLDLGKREAARRSRIEAS